MIILKDELISMIPEKSDGKEEFSAIIIKKLLLELDS